MSEQRPGIGIGVLVLKDGQVLMAQRLDKRLSQQEFQLPGGHLEYGESFEDCAAREVREEAGVDITPPEFLMTANLIMGASGHFVQLGLVAQWKSGTPINLEPDKAGPWQWYPLEALPQPQYFPSRCVIEAYKQGKMYLGTRKD